MVAVFCLINYRGASEAGGAGNLVTSGKILLLAIFIGFGVSITVHKPDWHLTFTQNFMPNGIGHVFIAMGLTFIAFEGYEIIAQCSEEVRAPERNVPRAIFLSLLIVVPIYLLVAFAALGAAQPGGDTPSWQYLGQLKETALVNVARNFFPGGDLLILIGGLFSTMSALNATIYSSSRVSFAMGRDRNLPSWFGSVHPLRKTPHWAILASGVLSIIMAVSLPIETVASAANIMFLLLFIQVQAALITLRKKRPDLNRGFKVPFVPLVPIIGIILQLALAVFLFFYSPMAWLSAACGLAWGWWFFTLTRAGVTAPMNKWCRCARRQKIGNTGFWPALAIRGGPKIILNAAVAVARQYDAELITLSVVEVPDRELLAQGFERAQKAREMLAQAVADLRTRHPAKVVVKISHRISYATFLLHRIRMQTLRNDK